MDIEEYIKTFKSKPPQHLVRDGKVWCPSCGKNPPQVKKIFSLTGLFPCEECQKKQTQHPPFAPLSTKERLDNMSPEQVLSGGLGGNKNEFGKESRTGWHEEHKQEVKNFMDAVQNL